MSLELSNSTYRASTPFSQNKFYKPRLCSALIHLDSITYQKKLFLSSTTVVLKMCSIWLCAIAVAMTLNPDERIILTLNALYVAFKEKKNKLTFNFTEQLLRFINPVIFQVRIFREKLKHLKQPTLTALCLQAILNFNNSKFQIAIKIYIYIYI